MDISKKKIRRDLILRLIEKELDLNNKNKNFFFLCPFHKEKTPSFQVNKQTFLFHCFGCGMNGNLKDFLLKHKNRENNLLTKKKSSNFARSDKDIFCIYKITSIIYQKQLFSFGGKNFLKYILHRKVSIKIIKKFKIGYINKSSFYLIKRLKENFSKKRILDSKIINKNKNFSFNTLYERISFPIKNNNDEIVAFGGRVINKNLPKYLNSSENPIFKKSNILYGYSEAKDNILEKNSTLIVEGYMDVINLFNNNIKNVVASLGININNNQLTTLWECCNKIIICFDNDASGKKAKIKVAHKAIEYIKPNKRLNFIELKYGKDPDEIINKKGEFFFKQLLKKSLVLSNYIFKSEINKLNISTIEGKLSLEVTLKRIISKIRNPNIKKKHLFFFKKQYLNIVMKKIDFRSGFFLKKNLFCKNKKKIALLNFIFANTKSFKRYYKYRRLIRINIIKKKTKLELIKSNIRIYRNHKSICLLKKYIKNKKESYTIKEKSILKKEDYIPVYIDRRKKYIKMKIKKIKNIILLNKNLKLIKKMIYLKKII